ncbi:MAG TPA: hypothetical protein VFE58_00515 [Tepidisphaeraceae bacterium]|jgi:hypothetical protein|nr:hypothetical protein [Tepidisphaeraceae bacterium]
MQRIITILLLSTLIGCASQHPASTAQTPALTPTYAYPASALVFDPPIAYNVPALDLSRNDRGPSAFAGFQQSTTSLTYTFTDDHQSTDFHNSYDRYSYISQIGTSVR